MQAVNDTSTTKQSILRVAIELFGQYGLHTTTRSIVSKANTNISSLHYYFGNKESLYLECAQYICENVKTFLDSMHYSVDTLDFDVSEQEALSKFIKSKQLLCAFFLKNDESKACFRFLARELFEPSLAKDIIEKEIFEQLLNVDKMLLQQGLMNNASESLVIDRIEFVYGGLLFIVKRHIEFDRLQNEEKKGACYADEKDIRTLIDACCRQTLRC